jgi:hypothetical protein
MSTQIQQIVGRPLTPEEKKELSRLRRAERDRSPAVRARKAKHMREYRALHANDPDFIKRNLQRRQEWWLKARDTDHGRAILHKASRKWQSKPGNIKRQQALVRKFMVKHPEMRQAHTAVYRALRRGDIVRPDVCSRCEKSPGLSPTGRSLLHAHHYLGYAREHWLDVQFLCPYCHGNERRKKRSLHLVENAS